MKKVHSIQKRLMRVIMITSGAILLLSIITFVVYELMTYQTNAEHELTAVGEIIATNSTGALAFDNKSDADETLASLHSRKNITAACLYDKQGRLFTSYPIHLSNAAIPKKLRSPGVYFIGSNAEVYVPVVQDNVQLGTLYIKATMQSLYDRMMVYAIAALVFTFISLLVAYLLSKKLQRSISDPIRELAGKAKSVSEQQDYTVRAVKTTNDELGFLTDAFNHMLATIEHQTKEIHTFNSSLEQKIKERTTELQNLNNTLQEQNQFIQTIIDSSIDLIAVFDKNMRYITLNKQANIIYKREREEMLGKHLLEVFPYLKDKAFTINLEKALSGEFTHHPAYKSLTSDRYFENFFIPLQNSEGVTDKALVIGHDITSIMQANEQLQALNTQLGASNRDLEQFAYVASHDLQEPLRKIRIFSELGETSINDPEKVKGYLNKINKAAARMTQLIEAVLNYSRLSNQNTELFTEVDLQQVLEDIKHDLELTIENKQAIITSNKLPVVYGNPLQMRQLFLNLISNSLKFSERQPQISITASPVEGGVHLEFSDNGIGFEEQFAKQIFSIFQRLHPKDKYSGTGIGLALCKKIVENHKGTITVKSSINSGTTFNIYLPALPVTAIEKTDVIMQQDEEQS